LLYGIFSSASAVLGNDRALFTKESTSIMVGRRFGEPQGRDRFPGAPVTYQQTGR